MTNPRFLTAQDAIGQYHSNITIQDKLQQELLDNIKAYNTESYCPSNRTSPDHSTQVKKKKLRRKISKSECDLPSQQQQRYESTPRAHMTTRLESRSSSESRSINVCPECVGELVTLYAPVCKHMLNEMGYAYIRVPRCSLDSSGSSNYGDHSYDANDLYNNILYSPYETNYETDDPDTRNHTEIEIEKLWKKINKAKSNLLKLQELQDENVTMYLQAANSQTESVNNTKTKLHFERNNRKTNVTIQGLQKKLDKYYQQMKLLEENRLHESQDQGIGNKKIIQVVHEHAKHMRSRASSFQDNVFGQLESLTNNFVRRKKRSLSMTDIEITYDFTSCNNNNDNNNNNNSAKNIYTSSRTTSEEELQQNNYLGVRKTGLVLPNSSFQQTRADDEIRDDEVITLRLRLDALEGEGDVMRDTVYEVKEMLSRALQSLQDEKYKIQQLQRRLTDIDGQWNDMTELHQNETSGIRDEIERTFECIERIEYRFADKNTDLREHVENCATRLSMLEKEHEDQLQQPSYHTDARLLLSKLLSFVINILLGIIFLAIYLTKMAAVPFACKRTRLVGLGVGMVTVVVVWSTTMLEYLTDLW